MKFTVGVLNYRDSFKDLFKDLVRHIHIVGFKFVEKYKIRCSFRDFKLALVIQFWDVRPSVCPSDFRKIGIT